MDGRETGKMPKHLMAKHTPPDSAPCVGTGQASCPRRPSSIHCCRDLTWSEAGYRLAVDLCSDWLRSMILGRVKNVSSAGSVAREGRFALVAD